MQTRAKHRNQWVPAVAMAIAFLALYAHMAYGEKTEAAARIGAAAPIVSSVAADR